MGKRKKSSMAVDELINAIAEMQSIGGLPEEIKAIHNVNAFLEELKDSAKNSEDKDVLLIILTMQALLSEYVGLIEKYAADKQELENIHDELALVNAQRNVNDIYKEKINVIDKIVKYALQLSRLMLDKKKLEEIKKASYSDLEEYVEPTKL